jgi:DNA-binding MarR family transcriptional regulator
VGKKQNLQTVTRPELMSDGKDTAFRSMLYDFFAFGSTLDEARAGFAGYIGLSPTQYLSLIVIARANEPVGVNQVAKRLHLSGPFVTIEINKLVRTGLVEKRPHPSDGRRVQLFVTPLGLTNLARLAELQRPVNDALFETLSREEFDALRDIMRRLSEAGARALQLAKFHLHDRRD